MPEQVNKAPNKFRMHNRQAIMHTTQVVFLQDTSYHYNYKVSNNYKAQHFYQTLACIAGLPTKVGRILQANQTSELDSSILLDCCVTGVVTVPLLYEPFPSLGQEPLADPGGFRGVQTPLWAAPRKAKTGKTVYLVRCGQVATPPLTKSWIRPRTLVLLLNWCEK